jgi:copper homeostasis protein
MNEQNPLNRAQTPAKPPNRSRRVRLEVCIASAEDAEVAAGGGADRLELNSALELGGLTPSLGCLAETREATRLPVVAMIRPRPGGFCYSAGELRTLRRDADLALEYGAAGIAFGVLTPDGRVDVARCRGIVEIVRQAGAAEGAVFHRAFDYTPDPLEALEQLIDLGVRRVMTSGQRLTAEKGAGLIAELIRRSAGRIEVLPAAGIRPWNVTGLVARTGCDQVHASLREKRPDPSLAARPGLPLAGGGETREGGDTSSTSSTSPVLVANCVGVLSRLSPP